MNGERITASEEVFNIISEFDGVVELLRNAGDKINMLKKRFVSGEMYMGTAEDMIYTYYTQMENKVEQLICLYEGGKQYSVNAVSSILLMDKMLSGQYNMAVKTRPHKE